MIFLDLTRVYGALDRSRCLEILEGYVVGPNARRLLPTYWRRLTMVSRVAVYYRTAFVGERGVTQGDPLSPTIFNVVVDAVVRNWVTGMVEAAEAKGETGREGRHQLELFYADDGMVVSSDPAWIQGPFTALVAIFDRVGLTTNVGKTVSMVCHLCQAGAGNRTDEAYGRRITGEGRSYGERQRERVACGECGYFVAIGSMSSHLMNRHGTTRCSGTLTPPPSVSCRRGTPTPSFPASPSLPSASASPPPPSYIARSPDGAHLAPS